MDKFIGEIGGIFRQNGVPQFGCDGLNLNLIEARNKGVGR